MKRRFKHATALATLMLVLPVWVALVMFVFSLWGSRSS